MTSSQSGSWSVCTMERDVVMYPCLEFAPVNTRRLFPRGWCFCCFDTITYYFFLAVATSFQHSVRKIMFIWDIQGGTMAPKESWVKENWSLNDNGPGLTWGLMMLGRGDRTDDRSPLVKYYQASFSCISPPSWYHTVNGNMWLANDLPIWAFWTNRSLTIESHPSPWADGTDGLGSHSDCWALFTWLQMVCVLFCNFWI